MIQALYRPTLACLLLMSAHAVALKPALAQSPNSPDSPNSNVEVNLDALGLRPGVTALPPAINLRPPTSPQQQQQALQLRLPTVPRPVPRPDILADTSVAPTPAPVTAESGVPESAAAVSALNPPALPEVPLPEATSPEPARGEPEPPAEPAQTEPAQTEPAPAVAATDASPPADAPARDAPEPPNQTAAAPPPPIPPTTADLPQASLPPPDLPVTEPPTASAAAPALVPAAPPSEPELSAPPPATAPAQTAPAPMAPSPTTAAPTAETPATPSPTAPAPTSGAEEQEVAALAPPADIPARSPQPERTQPRPAPAGTITRVLFDTDTAAIIGESRSQLEATAQALRFDPRRIELKAYGGAPGDKASGARRIALKRGLAVRAYLIDQGIDSRRIDVRAMGGITDAGAPDRVDVVYSGS